MTRPVALVSASVSLTLLAVAGLAAWGAGRVRRFLP
jgi:hypothetical protein